MSKFMAISSWWPYRWSYRLVYEVAPKEYKFLAGIMLDLYRTVQAQCAFQEVRLEPISLPLIQKWVYQFLLAKVHGHGHLDLKCHRRARRSPFQDSTAHQSGRILWVPITQELHIHGSYDWKHGIVQENSGRVQTIEGEVQWWSFGP